MKISAQRSALTGRGRGEGGKGGREGTKLANQKLPRSTHAFDSGFPFVRNPVLYYPETGSHPYLGSYFERVSVSVSVRVSVSARSRGQHQGTAVVPQYWRQDRTPHLMDRALMAPG